jgi:hypothetical protein
MKIGVARLAGDKPKNENSRRKRKGQAGILAGSVGGTVSDGV